MPKVQSGQVRGQTTLAATKHQHGAAASGIGGLALDNVLFTIGLDQTSTFSVALLISTGPVFTMLTAVALDIERTRRGQRDRGRFQHPTNRLQ